VLDAVNALTDEQAATIAEFIYQGPVPMDGATDVPADASGFTHPPANHEAIG
jgi:hypothetical protein